MVWNRAWIVLVVVAAGLGETLALQRARWTQRRTHALQR